MTDKVKIKKILLPAVQNLDMIVAAFLFYRYGEQKYPGSRAAAFVHENTELQGRDVTDLIQSGFFPLHRIPGIKEIQENSSTKTTITGRVCEHLEISRLPEIQKLLRWVERTSETGRPVSTADELDNLFNVSKIMEDLQQTDIELKELLDRVFPLFDAHLQQQKRHYYNLPEEWSRIINTAAAKIHNMKNGEEPIVVAVVKSDSPDMDEFLFNYKKVEADVVVQQFADFTIAIKTKPKTQINLDDVARIVRIEEARKHSRDYFSTIRIEFTKAGVSELIPEWLYDKASFSLTNHSTHTHKDSLPKTNLSLDEIVSAVYIGLGAEVWEQKCPSPEPGCRGNKCYFYDYGLSRCRAREIEMIPDMIEEKYLDRKNQPNKRRYQHGRQAKKPD